MTISDFKGQVTVTHLQLLLLWTLRYLSGPLQFLSDPPTSQLLLPDPQSLVYFRPIQIYPTLTPLELIVVHGIQDAGRLDRHLRVGREAIVAASGIVLRDSRDLRESSGHDKG